MVPKHHHDEYQLNTEMCTKRRCLEPSGQNSLSASSVANTCFDQPSQPNNTELPDAHVSGEMEEEWKMIQTEENIEMMNFMMPRFHDEPDVMSNSVEDAATLDRPNDLEICFGAVSFTLHQDDQD